MYKTFHFPFLSLFTARRYPTSYFSASHCSRDHMLNYASTGARARPPLLPHASSLLPQLLLQPLTILWLSLPLLLWSSLPFPSSFHQLMLFNFQRFCFSTAYTPNSTAFSTAALLSLVSASTLPLPSLLLLSTSLHPLQSHRGINVHVPAQKY
jgi:hypothetical protein